MNFSKKNTKKISSLNTTHKNPISIFNAKPQNEDVNAKYQRSNNASWKVD